MIGDRPPIKSVDVLALLALRPQVVGRVAGEAFVQADVRPLPHRHGVAPPLMGVLVHDRVQIGPRRVDGPGLGLQREIDVGVHEDPATGLERIRAVEGFDEVQHLRQTLFQRAGALGRGREGTDQRGPVGAPLVQKVEVIDGHRGQVADHRVPGGPLHRARRSVHHVPHPQPVRHRLPLLRNRDGEIESRLVQGRVVDRVPGCGRMRFVRDESAAAGREPPAAPFGLHAAVLDGDGERQARQHRQGRADGQLVVAVAVVPGGQIVHRNPLHRWPVEVQIECPQRLRRNRIQPRPPGEPVARRVVVDGDGIVVDAVTAIAVVGIVRITEPRRPDERIRGRLRPRGQHATAHQQHTRCKTTHPARQPHTPAALSAGATTGELITNRIRC